MPSIGVNIGIIQNEKILLTLREDFEIWCLPGGGVDEGETLAHAARREVREEVGLDVQLTDLIGTYSEAHWYHGGLHIILFRGRPTGGELQLDRREVLEARYFGPDELPEPLMYGHRQRILDVFGSAGGGVVWSQDRFWPFEKDLSRSDLYALRDRSGLSRREFYLKYFAPLSLEDEWPELGNG
jgi:ADP-ribose pyrophosphatase YjhB (NUDIX family)